LITLAVWLLAGGTAFSDGDSEGYNLLKRARLVAAWPVDRGEWARVEWISDHELAIRDNMGQDTVYDIHTGRSSEPREHVKFSEWPMSTLRPASEMVAPPSPLHKYNLLSLWDGGGAAKRQVFVWRWVGKNLSDLPPSGAPRGIRDLTSPDMRTYLWTSLRDGSHLRYLGYIPDYHAQNLDVPGGKYVCILTQHKLYIVPSLQDVPAYQVLR
jgi:hypothetical protein